MKLALCLVAILGASSLCAQSFDERHARDLAANPRDLHFRLSTPPGPFRIGERIPLVLEFSSDTPDKYRLDGATYDRGGRLYSEEFVTERDIRDPYADYFGAGVIGGMAGGLRGISVLTRDPTRVELSLNEWFAFDRPGRYRLYLKSHRLTRERLASEPGDGRTVEFGAASNILTVEIAPADRAWESRKLREIEEVLDRPAAPPPALPSDAVRIAWRDLRFLATPGAVRLSLQDARRPERSVDTFLLVGARDRADMLRAFDEYLANPAVAWSEWEIRLRAFFSWLAAESPKPLPFVRHPAQDEIVRIQIEAASRQKSYREALRAEAIRLLPAVRQKHEDVREGSARTIAALAPEAAKAAGLIPPEDYGLTRKELIAGFASFREKRQSELLNEKWDLVRGPEMIPVLLRLPRPSDDALRRLFELSPKDAEDVIRKDLASGRPRYATFAVREFPARDIPEADAALANLLRTDRNAALPLIAKFGTAALADQVRAVDPSRHPCAEEEPYVAYFVRIGQGADVLKRAMANREQRGCYKWMLSRVVQVVWNVDVERQALASLEDADPEVAADAARVLSERGSPGVEPALWRTLERWSGTWRGRQNELNGNPIMGNAPHWQAELGRTLFRAIDSAEGWVIDETRRKRLLALCVDDGCRKQYEAPLAERAIPIEVTSGAGSIYPASFLVDWVGYRTIESMKRKLQRYPAGTVFGWCPTQPLTLSWLTKGQLDEIRADLARFLAEHSMSMAATDDCVARLQ